MNMHYIDRGCGSPVVMVHGNPTWSYFYRDLIDDLSGTHHIIAPDHIGMGLSDKPQDAAYDLAFHIENLTRLIEHLELEDITLIVHDWGGAIGMGYAVDHIDIVSKIVILNSAAFFDPHIPLRIRVCRGAVGGSLTRRLNLFARAASFMATDRALTKEEKAAYLEPYATFEDRIGITSFLQDIPIEKGHGTRPVLDRIESKLPSLTSDVLILWGMRDFCFTEHFLDRWRAIFPQAQVVRYEHAGHYI
ncbi:MAG: alpha/beta fold hydrolase, partial [Actinomycetia bacterium]|nr:alpha/beta fold hydrolase [Actinomycetes bacterium]